MITSSKNIVHSAASFGKRVDALRLLKDGELLLDLKHRKTLVEKRGSLYTVTQFDAAYAPIRREHVGQERFEYNFRHFI